MSRKGRHTRRKVSKNRVRQEIEHMTLHPFMDAAEVRGWVMSGVCIDKHRDPMWASGKATCPVFGGEVYVGCDLKNIDREIKRRFRINPDLQRLPVGEVGTAVASGIVWNENKANLAPEPCAPGYIPPNEIWASTRLRSRSVEFRRLPKGLQDFFSTWMERAKDLSVKPLKDSGGKWPLLGHATKVWWKQGSLDELAQMREVRRILDETRNQDSRLDLMTLLALEEAEQEPLESAFRAFPLRDYCQSHGVVMRLKEGEENKEGMVGLMEEYLFNLAFSCADTPQKQYEVARGFFPLLRDSTIQQVLPAKKEESEEENRTGQHSPPEISGNPSPNPSLADRPREAMEKVAGIVEQGLQILASLGYEMPTEARHDPPPIAEGVDFPDDWVVLFEDRLMGRWTVRVTPQEAREEERATA